MKTLAVFIPGIGYHCDKPLLYYAKKLLIKYGCDCIEIAFEQMEKSNLAKSFKIGVRQTEQQLMIYGIEKIRSYDRIVFVSKSMGTGIAGTLQAKWEDFYDNLFDNKIRNIYFTPVRQLIHTLCPNSIVFHGTNDSWVETEQVVNVCKEKELTLYTIENADHSMETGDVVKDIENMQTIIMKCERHIKEWIE